jgi:polyhydroxybutyrate depolymerase
MRKEKTTQKPWKNAPRKKRSRFQGVMAAEATAGKVFFGLLLAVLAGFSSGCAETLPRDRIVGPKTYANTVDIRINGFRRTYLVHVPPGYKPESPLPLVVVIHGAFDTAKGMEKVSGFSELADREGFVVLYPNGMGIMGFLQHWNAGHCCGKAAEDQLDDVGYVAETIKDVCSRLKIDRDRIYMVGFSNGGMLAYRFAAERGDLLAAVAPLAASIGGKPSEDAPQWHIPDPRHPLSVISFHGLEDDDVPYEGGPSRHRGGTRTYWSVEKSIEFWVGKNGCSQEAKEAYFSEGAVHLKSWVDCMNHTGIWLYLIKGWGHVWPGKYFTATLAEGDALRNFDAAEIIWDHFESLRRER